MTTFTVFIDSASRALVSASTALASFALTSSALSADACEPCTAVTSASIGPPTLSRGTLAAARTSLILLATAHRAGRSGGGDGILSAGAGAHATSSAIYKDGVN